MSRKSTRIRAAAIALALALPACGGGNASTPQEDVASGPTLTVYSGREEEFLTELLDTFERESGIDLEVRYGDSAELAATILEEGEASPADVFFAQDAASLGAVAQAGLLQRIDQRILNRVDPRFRARDGMWVGTSGRARVVAYNTDALGEDELPESIFEFTKPEWRGRFGLPPTNASFQANIAAMLLTEGEDVTRDFLEGIAANEPRYFPDNVSTVRAIAAGEIDAGFVNHYYIYEIEAEEGEIPVENHFLSGGDPGALVNTAGVAIVRGDNTDRAAEFVSFLTGKEGQTYFPENVYEYPVAKGFDPPEGLIPLEEIESPEVDLSDIGGSLEPALALLAEAGLL